MIVGADGWSSILDTAAGRCRLGPNRGSNTWRLRWMGFYVEGLVGERDLVLSLYYSYIH